MSHVEPLRRRLPTPAAPVEQVVLHLVGDERPVALVGAWAGGGALLTSEPVERATPDEAFAALDRLPTVGGEAPAGFVGGGWFGVLGYRLGRDLERRPLDGDRPVPRPGADLAFHDHVIHLDADGAWWFEALVTPGRAVALLALFERWERRLADDPPHVEPATFGPATATPNRNGHCAAVERAQLAIGAGGLYQANVCLRLDVPMADDVEDGALLASWAGAVEQLRPARAAYVGAADDPTAAVASVSPEVFLLRSPDRASLRSEPIKGTRPLTDAGRAELVAATKDRAEHVMIVDLVRNDLTHAGGRTSVPSLLAPHPMAGVWHLVSTVEASLDPDVSHAQVLAATFPPGSVTGAPKVAATSVCDRLEATAREAYTGAIGFASPAAGLELNVAIRTVEAARGKAWLGVGGGIVADSSPVDEWRECRAKAEPVLRAFGSTWPRDPRAVAHPEGCYDTLLVRDGVLVRPDAHLARLARSTAEPVSELRAALEGAVAATPPRPWARARIDVVDGATSVVVAEAAQPSCLDLAEGVGPLRSLDLVPVPYAGGWGDRKIADRSWFEALEAKVGEGRAALLVDHDAVLETTRAAVLSLHGRTLRAPALDGRILPSVSRRTTLDLAVDLGLEVVVGPLSMDDLLAADAVLLTSSIQLLHLGRPTWGRVLGSPSSVLDDLARAVAATLPSLRAHRPQRE